MKIRVKNVDNNKFVKDLENGTLFKFDALG